MNGIIGKYHVSKNLFDATWESGSIGNAGGNLSDTNAIRTVGFIVCEAEKLYSFNPEYDVTETWVNYYDNNGGLSRYKITDGTFTTPQGCTRLRFRLSKTDIGVAPVPQPLPMLNVGTPLPYEPYDTEVWHDISYARLESATDTLSALPVTTYNDGTSATVAIKGNMQQNGTPTPSSPITPSECGERTENLFDGNLINAILNDTTGEAVPNDNWRCTDYMAVDDSTVTVGWNSSSNFYQAKVASYDSSKAFISLETMQNYAYSNTFTLPNGTKYIRVSFSVKVSGGDVIRTNIMINNGTVKPYEPYGYKLPVVSGGVTTNIYLSSTQTVRQVNKLVLTGNENWQTYQSGALTVYNLQYITDYLRVSDNICICSHYPTNDNVSGAADAQYGISFINNVSVSRLYLRDDNIATVSALQQYLADQYAAGTPVTIWYVLATPTTGIVNEPIRKIGDYADSVSVTNIPTITGGQTFDINTTLKPSEVDLTYHGWHEHEAEKRENGQWV